MRYFVTGATGWIGSATVTELIADGHEVVGLARSDANADALSARGLGVHRGSLEDLDSLRAGAEASDGVIHLGYIHDFSRMADAAQTDLAAITAFGEALAGSGRPLLIASGTVGLAPAGHVGTEEDVPDTASHPRIAGANATLALAQRGVRSMVMRFPPTVHGSGDHGFIATLVGVARDKGVSGYVDDGRNRWPAVHVNDAGRLVASAVQRAEAGTVWHATAEEGVETRDIATAIGEGLGLPVESIPRERAGEHFGWIGMFFGADAAASSTITRQRLDWRPNGPTLLDDLRAGRYFA